MLCGWCVKFYWWDLSDYMNTNEMLFLTHSFKFAIHVSDGQHPSSRCDIKENLKEYMNTKQQHEHYFRFFIY